MINQCRDANKLIGNLLVIIRIIWSSKTSLKFKIYSWNCVWFVAESDWERETPELKERTSWFLVMKSGRYKKRDFRMKNVQWIFFWNFTIKTKFKFTCCSRPVPFWLTLLILLFRRTNDFLLSSQMKISSVVTWLNISIRQKLNYFF